MDNCAGRSYDGAVNMAGRYAGALTLIQHQFAKIILFLDKFILVQTSHTNSWIHPSHFVLIYPTLLDKRFKLKYVDHVTRSVAVGLHGKFLLSFIQF